MNFKYYTTLGIYIMDTNVKSTKKSLTIFFFSLALLYCIMFSVGYIIMTPVTTFAAIAAFFWTFTGSEILTKKHNVHHEDPTWGKTILLTVQASILGPLNYLHAK